uniref:Nitrilase and fragile histidine triad fusion protein NitFhit n=1 Tax=Panagrellus redivivus TaxID=6233 RepID=A0A7E4VXA6_PANRE
MPFLTRIMHRIVKNPKVAVCQLTVNHLKDENSSKCHELIAQAKDSGCEMVFFPECSDYIGRSKDEALSLAEPVTSGAIKSFTEYAEKHKIWVSVGGFHNRKHDDVLPSNTHVIINSNGEIVSQYDKLHQFNIDIPGKVRLLEREFSSEGSKLIPPVETPIGRVGLAICYDLRFPELSIYNRISGADILTFPAAFTVPTGMAHWEVLLRARAIENQCYVIAAAQYGKHNDNRSSYGHAMIVDPYGKVVAQCSDKEGLAIAEIDLDYQNQIRQNLDVFSHRRNDLYSIYYKERLEVDAVSPALFGAIEIPPSQIFYRSRLSFAFVNLKPILPGHVLISPTRVVERLSDLTTAENSDLMNTVQLVQKMLEKHYNNGGYTVSIQDGVVAGQTIPHVHVHTIPRSARDFGGETDKVYAVLDSNDRPSRTTEEMAAEAEVYRKIMYE